MPPLSPSPPLPPGEGRGEGAAIARLREAFGERLWIGASLIYGVNMRNGLIQCAALARSLGAPLIATNDALMHAPERRALADVLTCIREKTTLEAAGRLIQANAERHLKGPSEMARLFADAPDALAETIRFLDSLAFSLDELKPLLSRGAARRPCDGAGSARGFRGSRRGSALSGGCS